MLKVSLKSSVQDHMVTKKEGVSGTKHFYWVSLYGIRSFRAQFHHFSCFCVYIKFPRHRQKLLMYTLINFFPETQRTSCLLVVFLQDMDMQEAMSPVLEKVFDDEAGLMDVAAAVIPPLNNWHRFVLI